jgi:hypothetical protein
MGIAQHQERMVPNEGILTSKAASQALTDPGPAARLAFRLHSLVSSTL